MESAGASPVSARRVVVGSARTLDRPRPCGTGIAAAAISRAASGAASAAAVFASTVGAGSVATVSGAAVPDARTAATDADEVVVGGCCSVFAATALAADGVGGAGTALVGAAVEDEGAAVEAEGAAVEAADVPLAVPGRCTAAGESARAAVSITCVRRTSDATPTAPSGARSRVVVLASCGSSACAAPTIRRNGFAAAFASGARSASKVRGDGGASTAVAVARGSALDSVRAAATAGTALACAASARNVPRCTAARNRLLGGAPRHAARGSGSGSGGDTGNHDGAVCAAGSACERGPPWTTGSPMDRCAASVPLALVGDDGGGVGIWAVSGACGGGATSTCAVGCDAVVALPVGGWPPACVVGGGDVVVALPLGVRAPGGCGTALCTGGSAPRTAAAGDVGAGGAGGAGGTASARGDGGSLLRAGGDGAMCCGCEAARRCSPAVPGPASACAAPTRCAPIACAAAAACSLFCPGSCPMARTSRGRCTSTSRGVMPPTRPPGVQVSGFGTRRTARGRPRGGRSVGSGPGVLPSSAASSRHQRGGRNTPGCSVATSDAEPVSMRRTCTGRAVLAANRPACTADRPIELLPPRPAAKPGSRNRPAAARPSRVASSSRAGDATEVVIRHRSLFWSGSRGARSPTPLPAARASGWRSPGPSSAPGTRRSAPRRAAAGR